MNEQAQEVQIAWATHWRTYADVHAAAYREAYRGIMDEQYLAAYTPENRQTHYAKLVEAGDGGTSRAAILSINGEPAGCLLICSSKDADLADGYGEIDALYLLPDSKGRGYGRLLLSWGMGRLAEQGCSAYVLWVLEENEAARRFYERMGFHADGASRIIERGRKLVQLRYICSNKTN
ncbi:GCN5-related N-acetyltransferase [Paenibacillus curdlanolyticus YK9]|uniref:GCN5-related N-acetyltransferase n=1 Tax=Paenibacillus curdlanolyticus YK9 TaxID=717606 RepID=E0I619_9BACL|nr:GNAT family N-acetyltransferase [Paenibacillus curdlanolyticus]EFM12411.1 GCN5-related N-acetyltransferase [Paenibacillus curdlanolyticus YK9]